MVCLPAIASMSLGHAWVHALPEKLARASEAGLNGVEIFYEDLEYAAKSHGESSPENLIVGADEVRKLCDAHGLTVIGLQPFLFYEGLTDRSEHAKKIEKLKLWFRLVKTLGTDIIQIPTNFFD